MTNDLTKEAFVALYNMPQDHPDLPVLIGLESIDWLAIGAADVPALLRALLSNDERHRYFAFELLHEAVSHLGEVVTEASAPVVPFLFSMLKSRATPDLEYVVWLLASLARAGSSFDDIDDQHKAQVRRSFAKRHSNLDLEIAKSREWVRLTREAISKDLPLLYPYVGAASPYNRQPVAEVLAIYPERAQEVIPFIESGLTAATDRYERMQLEITLATLKGEPLPYQPIANAWRVEAEPAKCPSCGGVTYESRGGTSVCPTCGFGARHPKQEELERDPKAIFRRFYEEAWNRGDMAAVNLLLSPRFRNHELHTAGSHVEAYKQAVLETRHAFPDWRLEIDALMVEGDRVIARWVGYGTHTGEGFGFAPTGRVVWIEGFSMVRVKEGVITEYWKRDDSHTVPHQLGKETT